MQDTIRVAVVGISGYTGAELARLLAAHPRFELTMATSRDNEGRPLQELFPELRDTGQGELVVSAPDTEDIAARCDLAFLAVPNGAAMEMAALLLDKGIKVVDLSADFRLRENKTYTYWYGMEHTRSELLQEAVYGLPELYADRIAKARLVANPGCYPTSAILGLYPALAEGMIHPEGLILDSKSGASGAGKKLKPDFLFCEIENDFRPYGLGGVHRHTPEIEQELSGVAGKDLTVSFNPHLLPVDRGIISTMYADAAMGASLDDIAAAYSSRYRDTGWIRVLPQGEIPRLSSVRGSMYCDIGIIQDRRSGKMIFVSAIDNLCRGASGQALANANLMLGLDMGAGLGPRVV
ncbi:MAG: N-acetyl-gamma-glutamyl-phosphate reductase [Desulfohalobiaceae bacterium]|nr:N-acetyl-gamma-glutamyl-phosphate reductase [Desulfohalobiaceae bacterium]